MEILESSSFFYHQLYTVQYIRDIAKLKTLSHEEKRWTLLKLESLPGKEFAIAAVQTKLNGVHSTLNMHRICKCKCHS